MPFLVNAQTLLHARAFGWDALLTIVRERKLEGVGARVFIWKEVADGKWGEEALRFFTLHKGLVQAPDTIGMCSPVGTCAPTPVVGSASMFAWGFHTGDHVAPISCDSFFVSEHEIVACGLRSSGMSSVQCAVSSPYVIDVLFGSILARGKALLLVCSDACGMGVCLAPGQNKCSKGDFLCCISRPLNKEDILRDPCNELADNPVQEDDDDEVRALCSVGTPKRAPVPANDARPPIR